MLSRSYLWVSKTIQLTPDCGKPIFPIQCAALLTLHRKWFMVGIVSGKFLHWSSQSVTVLVGGHSQGCHGTSLLCLVFFRDPTNLWWHQFPGSSIDDEFYLIYIWITCGYNYCRCYISTIILYWFAVELSKEAGGFLEFLKTLKKPAAQIVNEKCNW